MRGTMARDADVVDALAAALFAVSGVFDFLIAAFLLASFVLALFGIFLVLLGLGAWWVAKGILQRNGEVWWLGVALAVLSLLTPFVPVPNLTPYLPNWIGALVALVALAYLILRRRRFGIGVRGTSGY